MIRTFSEWYKSLRMARAPRMEEYMSDYGIMSLDTKEIKICLLEKELTRVRKGLENALAERNSCTPDAFEMQINEMTESIRALARFEFMGGSKETETYRILNSNYMQQKARLQFMVHDTIEMPEEVAHARVQRYIDQMKEKEQ